MTFDQFEAWFEGFCEAITDAPTPEQWAKIKGKVAELRERSAATFREPEIKRFWLHNETDATALLPRVVRGPGGANCRALSPFSRETRVLDPITGADLGPSD